MKFEVEAKRFLAALKSAARATASSHAVNIHITTDGAGVSMVATDLDIGIRVRVPDAKVDANGSVSCSASDLLSAAGTIQNGLITVDLGKDMRLSMRSKERRTHVRVPGVSPDLHEPPDFDVTPALHVDGPAFLRSIRRVFRMAGNDPARENLRGVEFRFSPAVTGEFDMKAVATDGHRLSLSRERVKLGKDGLNGFPDKIRLDSRVLSMIEADGPKTVGLAMTKNGRPAFVCGDTVYISSVFAGEMPNISGILGSLSTERPIEIPVDALQPILVNAKKLTTLKGRAVDISVSGYDLTVRAENDDGGAFEDEAELPGHAEDGRFKANVQYVLDVLAAVQSARVEMNIGPPLSPVSFIEYNADGDDVGTFIVMPMRG